MGEKKKVSESKQAAGNTNLMRKTHYSLECCSHNLHEEFRTFLLGRERSRNACIFVDVVG